MIVETNSFLNSIPLLKERKTLQKKGLSQYDRNQFKGQDEGGARF
jgi:hypothetical protein